MLDAHKLRFESKLLLDYVSPQGGQVTAVRGSLVVANHKLLKAAGLYERYLSMLPPDHLDIASNTLAASWVEAEHNLIHLQTVDALQLSDQELSRMGETLGAHMLDSLFATLMRSARNAGAEGVWLAMKQSDRIFGRVYQGGGCSVIQRGPKDAVYEIHGIPFASSPVFRMQHCAFLRGVIMLLSKTCVVKPTRPREGKSDSLAVSISWV